jgi:hypothetical protein
MKLTVSFGPSFVFAENIMFMDRFGRQWNGPHALGQSPIWTHAPRTGGVYQVLNADGDTTQTLHIGAATDASIQQQLLRIAIALDARQQSLRTAAPRALSFAFIACDDVAAQRIVSTAERWAGASVRQLDALLEGAQTGTAAQA